jgi:2-hydroxy-3-oxopropionate reductase
VINGGAYTLARSQPNAASHPKTRSSTLSNVAVIGLGIMGMPMAVNLTKAGYSVTGYTRSGQQNAANRMGAGGSSINEAVPLSDIMGRGMMGATADIAVQDNHVIAGPNGRQKSERLVSEGVFRGAPSVAEAVLDADIVITVLPDSPDVEGVVSGPDGVFANAKQGALWIDTSSIRPDVAKRLSDHARAAGIRPLDAPVSGGEQGAIDAVLAIMVGGDKADFDAAQDVLNVIGKTVVHVGPSGSGQTVKAANQLIVAVNIEVLAEAIVFLEAYGVDTDAALKVLGGGLAGSKVLDQKGQKMLARNFDPGFRLALHDKDLGIVTAAAREANVAIPIGANVAQLVAATVNQGDGGLDHSALLKLIEQLSRGSDKTRKNVSAPE